MNPTDNNILLFDLDGTLVDSAPDLARAVNVTLADLQRPAFDEALIRSWVGNGAQVLIERALSGSVTISATLDRTLAAQALSLFLAHYTQGLCIHSQLYAGVQATLLQLKSQGYRLAIVTNKPQAFVQPILDGLGLGTLFELIVGGDTLAKRKPDPLPLHYACQQLGASPQHCIMIGDSKNDILAAKAAQMRCIGLTYGYNYGEDIAVHGPDWVLDHFADIPAVLAD